MLRMDSTVDNMTSYINIEEVKKTKEALWSNMKLCLSKSF